MKLSHLRAHPRLLGSAAIGIAAGWLAPGTLGLLSRALLGWNAGVWLYLVSAGWIMFRSDANRMQRAALAQAESSAAVLALVVVAAIVSLVAIVLELSAAKAPHLRPALPNVLFTLLTVAGSWLLVPTLFALSYASLYYDTYDDGGAGALRFPDADKAFKPDYADFLYFAFTIAVASQTADVSITTRTMRRLVLLQSLLSFGFNATVLAFSINIAASLF